MPPSPPILLLSNESEECLRGLGQTTKVISGRKDLPSQRHWGGGGHCHLVIILWEGFIEHLPSICHCDLRTRAVDTVGFFRNTLYWPENSLVSESTIRNALCFWDREAAGQG